MSFWRKLLEDFMGYPYECPVCKRGFEYPLHAESHFKTEHPQQWADFVIQKFAEKHQQRPL